MTILRFHHHEQNLVNVKKRRKSKEVKNDSFLRFFSMVSCFIGLFLKVQYNTVNMFHHIGFFILSCQLCESLLLLSGLFARCRRLPARLEVSEALLRQSILLANRQKETQGVRMHPAKGSELPVPRFYRVVTARVTI